MTEISAEESQALRAAAGGKGDQANSLVSERNFSQPRRLSADRLQLLAQTIGATMQDIGNTLAAPLRSFHKIQVASLTEVNAANLFDDIEAPFVVMSMMVEESLGWLVWEDRAATAAIEQILAGEVAEDQEFEPRPLSPSEAQVLQSLLTRIAIPVCGSLGLKCKTDDIAQEEEGLKTLRDAGPGADTRRLMVHLSFDGPGGSSDMRLYLPNIDEGDINQDGPPQKDVPRHLGPVALDMYAELGSVQLPLRDLLALEIGDVLPLGTEVGGDIHLLVEGRSIAHGSWGQVTGSLAMKITKIDTESISND